jgi:hypothetical protein
VKPVEDVTACVIDYGSFMSLSETLARTMKKVYYYSPFEAEFQDLRDCIKGTGLDPVERLDSFLDPDVFDEIDLFIFPDIGYGGMQRHLRKLGKAVWGSMGADELELYRSYFLQVLEHAKLPIIPYEELTGLTALAEYLKENENKWIKVDRYRQNMETWHHLNYDQSARMLDSLAVVFGSAKDQVTFIAQDELKSDMEVGFDGWCVDGEFPPESFQGYEKKNELYLGSLLSAADLPKEIQTVNRAMAPVLKHYGYRNWWATEIRIADGVPYFIDPTARMAGQTMEHQLETCTNIADVVWSGANGVMLAPEFGWSFAAEATLHYDAAATDSALVNNEWKTLHLPDDTNLLRWLKLYHYCRIGDVTHFSPHKTDEVGVILGVGDSIEECVEHLKENLEGFKDVPMHANISGFGSLLASIKEAEEQGVEFAGGKIPKLSDIFEDAEI